MQTQLELARAGVGVDIFEMHPYAGGMVGGAIPEYRLPAGALDQDLAPLRNLGVRIHLNMKAGRDFHLSELRRDGFGQVVIMAGAQMGKKLGLEGEDCADVVDALQYLRQAREGHAPGIGRRIGIIGAGDTAMDCARTAWRLSADSAQSRVSVMSAQSGTGSETWTPTARRMTPATTWARSLTIGGRPNRSSHSPQKEIQLAPSTIPVSCTNPLLSGNSSSEPITAL